MDSEEDREKRKEGRSVLAFLILLLLAAVFVDTLSSIPVPAVINAKFDASAIESLALSSAPKLAERNIHARQLSPAIRIGVLVHRILARSTLKTSGLN